MASPIMAGEDGAPLGAMGQGFDFGYDGSEDPELAMVGGTWCNDTYIYHGQFGSFLFHSSFGTSCLALCMHFHASKPS